METLQKTNMIEKELHLLGIKENNSGVSTGLNWLKGDGNTIESYSPVDGALIASCTSASRAEYEIIVQTGSSDR